MHTKTLFLLVLFIVCASSKPFRKFNPLPRLPDGTVPFHETLHTPDGKGMYVIRSGFMKNKNGTVEKVSPVTIANILPTQPRKNANTHARRRPRDTEKIDPEVKEEMGRFEHDHTKTFEVVFHVERSLKFNIAADLNRKIAQGEITNSDQLRQRRKQMIRQYQKDSVGAMHSVMDVFVKLGIKGALLNPFVWLITVPVTKNQMSLIVQHPQVERCSLYQVPKTFGLDLNETLHHFGERSDLGPSNGISMKAEQTWFMKHSFSGSSHSTVDGSMSYVTNLEDGLTQYDHIGFRDANGQSRLAYWYGNQNNQPYYWVQDFARTVNTLPVSHWHAQMTAGVLAQRHPTDDLHSAPASGATLHDAQWNVFYILTHPDIETTVSSGSWGSTPFCQTYHPHCTVVDTNFKAGIAQFFSASNDGSNGCQVASPAVCQSTMAVGALGFYTFLGETVRKTRHNSLAGYSSHGYDPANGNTFVGLAVNAHLKSIMSATNQWATGGSGTSAASPHLASSATIIREYWAQNYISGVDLGNSVGALWALLLVSGDGLPANLQNTLERPAVTTGFDRGMGAGRLLARQAEFMPPGSSIQVGEVCMVRDTPVQLGFVAQDINIFKIVIWWYDETQSAGNNGWANAVNFDLSVDFYDLDLDQSTVHTSTARWENRERVIKRSLPDINTRPTTGRKSFNVRATVSEGVWTGGNHWNPQEGECTQSSAYTVYWAVMYENNDRTGFYAPSGEAPDVNAEMEGDRCLLRWYDFSTSQFSSTCAAQPIASTPSSTTTTTF